MAEAPTKNGPPAAAEPVPKVRLVGTVAGVDACEILTDREEIVVGSAIDCDLVVDDPLTPRRAFRLRHTKHHAGAHAHCDACWLIEAMPGARVYVNSDHTRRERLAFGDTVTVGCHHFRFENGDAASRERRSITNVSDVCGSLLNGQVVPLGFLSGQPSWRDRLRTRKAAWTGAAAAAVLLLACLLFWPRHERFDSVQPPLEVALLAERVTAPPPDAVRSLETVRRQTFDTPTPEAEPVDLQPAEIETVQAMPVETIASDLQPVAPAPPALELGPVVEDAGPAMAPLVVAAASTELRPPQRELGRMGQSAPVRRVSVTEATHPMTPAELGQLQAQATRAMASAPAATTYARQVVRRRSPQPAPQLDNRAETLAALKHEPTPIKEFQEYRGVKIPVARVPDELPSLAVAPGEGFVIDAEVTDAEIAASFKTGRFKIHAPGTPPEADPATYCYVSKATIESKEHLYISFVCTDPNLDALVVGQANGSPGLAWDDSVEVFLDFDGNRVDYHQLIVNAQGMIYAAHCANGDVGINGGGTPWNAGTVVKTTINRDAGQWVCEIAIPYDRIPSLPAKGTQIPANFCRNFRGQRAQNQNPNTLQNWFSVWDGNTSNYHHPSKFGLLEWP